MMSEILNAEVKKKQAGRQQAEERQSGAGSGTGQETDSMPVYDAVCLRSIRNVAEIFNGKWAYLVLEELHIGTMRFSELRRALDVSTKSLTDTLRHLEENGIISRTVRPTVPVTVEYALTEKGRAFDTVLLAMKEWENTWDAN